MAKVLDGANTTAQWYYDNFPGGAVFDRLEKFVLHTTETTGWPGYSGGASAPNATYHPRLREIRQHFPNNVSSRALRDPSTTPVRENRDRVFQLEIIAYSDKRLGDSVGGLWIGNLTDAHYTDIARMLIQLNREERLSLSSVVAWKEGATSFYGGVRMSSSTFDAYRGWCGHIHVSGNIHWDPGGFRASKLKAKIAQLTVPTPPPPTPTPEPEPQPKDPDMATIYTDGATTPRLRVVHGDQMFPLTQGEYDNHRAGGLVPIRIGGPLMDKMEQNMVPEGVGLDEEAPPLA